MQKIQAEMCHQTKRRDVKMPYVRSIRLNTYCEFLYVSKLKRNIVVWKDKRRKTKREDFHSLGKTKVR
jgi:hypothetical protein